MRKFKYLLEYFLNSFVAPKSYFEHIADIGGDDSEAIALLFMSGGIYGLLNSLRSLISTGLGEYATISTSQEAISIGLTNFVTGFQFILILTITISVIMHVAAFLSGLKGWKNTFYTITYASPSINLYILSLIIYELFQSFIIGFPLVKYILALISLTLIGYVLTRGIEAFHDIGFKKSAWIAAAPILAIIGIQIALVISLMLSLMSAL